MPAFDQWAVVKRESDGKLICQACGSKRRTCVHVTSLTSLVANIPNEKPHKSWDEKFDMEWDYTHGCRGLTCISRAGVPEDIDADSDEATRIRSIMHDRATSTARVPVSCVPDLNCTCSCGSQAWGPIHKTPSIIFLASAVVKSEFGTTKCNQCGNIMSVDGCEHALLRLTEARAFSYELLYEWSNTCGVSTVPWFKFWTSYIQRCIGLSLSERKSHITNCYKLFRRATLDFVQLMNIDYGASFTCSHEGPVHRQFDGISIGFHRDKCQLTVPWEATSQEVAKGSTFSDRLFLNNKEARELISDLGRHEGLSAESFNKLRGKLTSSHEETLLCLICV